MVWELVFASSGSQCLCAILSRAFRAISAAAAMGGDVPLLGLAAKESTGSVADSVIRRRTN
jgi:hypothetical protein